MMSKKEKNSNSLFHHTTIPSIGTNPQKSLKTLVRYYTMKQHGEVLQC